jgi:hypothetical protein
MTLIGFVGLGFAGYRKPQQKVAGTATAWTKAPLTRE